MDDYPPLDRTKPHWHNIMLFARPSASVAADIHRRARRFRERSRLSGRPLPADRLHVTLAYFGEYMAFPDGLVATIAAAMAAFAWPPIEVTFDRLFSFKGSLDNRPLVLTGGDGLADLRRFWQRLMLALIDARIEALRKTSFTPHITLLYDRRTIESRPIDPMVRWTLNEFVLIDSLRGETKHIPIARWPLRGGPNL